MNFRFSSLSFRSRGAAAHRSAKPIGPGASGESKIENPKSRISRGSVLIIVIVTLLFAVTALVAFMDKAMNDLLVDHRAAINHQLRMEAYSALETTLAVLEDFREADNGLHSVTEGWGDPLGFAGYTPSESGVTVDVAFQDESGKISLPHADAQTLSRLFQSWNVQQSDADMLADAMMGWMQRGHVYSTAIDPDYEQSAIPYDPPGRPLRSYAELAAIDKVRDFFYDSDGRPNDYWRLFVANVSLFNFTKTDINGATPGALAALGQFDPTQQQSIDDYLAGSGQYQNQGPNYFRDAGEAAAIVGQGGNASAFGTTISALRILITVHLGTSEFRLSAVVTTPSGGATVVQETATSQKTQTSAGAAQTAAQQQAGPNANQAAGGASGTNTQPTQDLRYPFKLLEIQENDEIPPAPPPVPATPPV